MEIRTIKGIVISEKSYGETSKILNILASDNKIYGVMSKGSKKLKSSLKAVSEKFCYGTFQISYKEDKLSILISGDVINNLFNIKKDIEKISYLNYLCELTSQVIKQIQYKNIYDLFISTILKIEDGFDPMILTNILEIKYLDFLGVSPYLDGCVICDDKNVVTLSLEKGGFVCKKHYLNEILVDKKTIKIIRMLKYVEINNITKLDISNKIKNEINNFLYDYYDKYTGIYLKSRDFLKNIVNLK